MILQSQKIAENARTLSSLNPFDPLQCEVVKLARCDAVVDASELKLMCRSLQLGCSTFAAVLDDVDRNLGSKVSLDAVAKKAGLSRATFTRKFRAVAQVSFHRYLTRRRIEVASRLLRDTTFCLAFIAEETGFCSQSHFATVFRDLTGHTPASFREGLWNISPTDTRATRCSACGRSEMLHASTG